MTDPAAKAESPPEPSSGTSKEKGKMPQQGKPTIWVATVIILIVFVSAATGQLPILGDASGQWTPFALAIVGVLLYVMSSAKSRRERFDLRYLPDYFYRGAQAVVYLYVILGILSRGDSTYDFETWSPNLIGLLVGLFILNVEKAMEALGQRFEEFLAAILPRTLTSPTSRERDLARMRAQEKYREITAQGEAMSSLIRDPAALTAFRKRLADVGQTIKDGEPGAIGEDVQDLAWQFEELKRATREEELTVAQILRADR